jgi:predicted Zn-dependent protease
LFSVGIRIDFYHLQNIFMKKLLLVLAVPFTLIACSRNAFTGRNQLTLYPEAEIQTMAAQEYRSFLGQNKVVSTNSDKDAEMVRRVGQRITAAVERYANENNLQTQLEGYKWEYNLVDSKDVNAWCMPGGKIVVYTGLLPITQNEAALAVVMGHEVTHAIARHGNERMSQGMVQQLGGVALSVALANKPAETQNLFQTAYGIGSNVGAILPFSRKNELEADKYGLFFTAMAGYNPEASIALWERMAQAGGGNRPPEMLSTHPVEEKRIAELKRIMPEALKLYRPVSQGK